MIDAESRLELAERLRGLAEAEGRIDDRPPIDSPDAAITEIQRAALGAYPDLAHCNLTSGVHSPETSRAVARCILFLMTELEFEWPRRSGIWNRLLTMKRAALGAAAGDLDVWPFYRREDYEGCEPDLTGVLQRIFRAHGLAAFRVDRALLVDSKLPSIEPTVHNGMLKDGSCSVQLDIALMLGGGNVICESFAGFGSSRGEAIDDAWSNFCNGSLPVFLAVFWGRTNQQVRVQQWQIDGTAWKATFGQFHLRNPDGMEFPAEAVSVMKSMITGLKPSGLLMWLRMFFSISQSGSIFEVLLNNEDWPAARQALENMPWPNVEGFYSVRWFVILERTDLA